MSANPFNSERNSVVLAVNGVTSNSIGPFDQGHEDLLITNRCASNAWISWTNINTATAAFPTAGDAVGHQGVEVMAHSQVTVGCNGSAQTVAAILADPAESGFISIGFGSGT